MFPIKIDFRSQINKNIFATLLIKIVPLGPLLTVETKFRSLGSIIGEIVKLSQIKRMKQ